MELLLSLQGRLTLLLDRAGKLLGKNRTHSLLVWESLDPTDSPTALLIYASKETGHLSRSTFSKPSLVLGIFPFFFSPFKSE